MRQFRAGERCQMNFLVQHSSLYMYSVLENIGCDGCWWIERWILLSNGYWAVGWLEMMFRHYWLAGDWSQPCRSRRCSVSDNPHNHLVLVSSPFFFPPHPMLARSSVAKYILKQEKSLTLCYSKKWCGLSFLFFLIAKLWPFLIKCALPASSLLQANML